MEFEYKDIYGHPSCVCLNLTDSCNLACKYCFVQQKPHFMTLDTAKKAVDWIIKNSLDNQNIDISFFGGEPMLMYDEIIVPLTSYIEEYYKDKITLGITTNGTLLNKERIDFLFNHKITVLLSIDGDEITQNFNRPQRNGEGSFSLVEKNIPYLLEKFPNTAFRATVYQPTAKYLYQNYQYAQKMGFKRIFFCPNAREKWTQEHILEFENEINKIFTDRTLQFLSGYMPIKFSMIDDIYRNILSHDLQIYNKEYEELDLKRRIFRCGLGTTSASIAYDGSIFACQEQDSRDTGDYFCIGNIFTGIDVQKHKQILQDYNMKTKLICEDASYCDTCPLRLTCISNICPSTSYDMFHAFFIKPKIDCIFYRALFENALASMKILVDQDKNEVFKLYLDDIYQEFDKKEEL